MTEDPMGDMCWFCYASAGSSDPLFFIPSKNSMPVRNECPKEQLQLGSDSKFMQPNIHITEWQISKTDVYLGKQPIACK